MPINSLMSIQSSNFSGVVVPNSICWYDMGDLSNIYDVSGNNVTGINMTVKTIKNKAVNSPNINNLVSYDVSANYSSYVITMIFGIQRYAVSTLTNPNTGFKTDGLTDLSKGFAVVMVFTSSGNTSPYWCKYTNTYYPFSCLSNTRYIGNGTSFSAATSSQSTSSGSAVPIIFYNDFNTTTMKYNEYVNSSGALLDASFSYYGDISSNPLYIGTRNGGFGGAYKYYEILVFPFPLSTNQRWVVEGWLATKHQLLDYLPSDHLYKGGYFGTNPLH